MAQGAGLGHGYISPFLPGLWEVPFSSYLPIFFLSSVDHLLGVENCQESMYGCCPDGLTAAEGPNFVGCAINDPIPTGLCVESAFGCCIDGVTPAAGPFNEGCHVPTCQVQRERRKVRVSK